MEAEEMNITLVNTLDSHGGAALAAVRLHLALLGEGADSRMLVRHRRGGVPHTTAVALDKVNDEAYPEIVHGQCIQRHIIDENRALKSDTYFSFTHPGLDISVLNIIQRADCVNLHWIERFLSPASLRRLFRLGKPVVWTLHDQAPFTGGCHYAMGCNGFKNGCSNCPQLGDNPWDLTAAALRDKAEAYGGANLTIVTPSRWMGGQAEQSTLLGGFRIEVIPNSLNIDVFRPVPKLEAREFLKLPADPLYLLLGSYDLKEVRKGTRQCMEALRHCLNDSGFQDKARVGSIRLLTFGYSNPDLEQLGIPVHALGYIESEDSLMMAYAAADVFILPSLEDNLPNTILEAMSCGTAIAAFAAGGIPEMVEEGITGRLARVGDTEHLAQTIVRLLDSDDRQAMGRNCRERVERDYAPHVQAGRYLDLFRELTVDAVDLKTGHQIKPGADNIQESEDAETFTVPVVSASGPGIEPVYDNLLLPALKKASLRLPMLEEKELILGGRDRIIRELQQRVKQDKTYIDDLHQKLEQDKTYIDNLHQKLEQDKTYIDDLHQKLEQDKTYIDDLHQKLEQDKTYIDDRSQRIEQGETHIEDLQGQIEDLQQRLERIHEDGLSWLLATATRLQRPYSFFHEHVPGMITVVMVNRNVTAGLQRSVRSVWAQSVPAKMLELFVCDDSSLDGARNVAASLAGESPVSMQTITYPDRLDRGSTAMRDLGISHARGEFIALLQPGDVWRPNRLSRQLQYLDEHPDAPCVCSRVDERNPEGRRVHTRRGLYRLDAAETYDFSPPYTFEQFLHGNPIADSTLLIRRSALLDVGSSPAHLAYPTGMWLQLAKFSLTRPIDRLEAPLVDIIVPKDADGNCFPSERAYGEDLEFLFHLLHWMVQHPRHRERGVQVYREQFPRLMNVRGDAYRLIEDFYKSYEYDGELFEFKEYFNSLSTELLRLRKDMWWVEGVKTVGRYIPGLAWTVRFINSLGMRLVRSRPG